MIDHVSLSAVRAATAANERALDALRLVNAPRPDASRQKLIARMNLAQAIDERRHERPLTGANAEFQAEQSRTQLPGHLNSFFLPSRRPGDDDARRHGSLKRFSHRGADAARRGRVATLHGGGKPRRHGHPAASQRQRQPAVSKRDGDRLHALERIEHRHRVGSVAR